MEVTHRGQFGEVAAIAPVFENKLDGFYVDIGSHDGITDSNTLHFSHLGWRGICIEPHLTYYPRLVKNRSSAICLNIVVWDEALPSISFYATVPGGWSRAEAPDPRSRHAYVDIQHPTTQTLDYILERYGTPTPFDLLSIDVEASEWHVLRGFTLSKYRPRIVVIEDLEKKRQFDSFFTDYVGVYSYYLGVRGSNVIYCREPGDAKVIERRWRKN